MGYQEKGRGGAEGRTTDSYGIKEKGNFSNLRIQRKRGNAGIRIGSPYKKGLGIDRHRFSGKRESRDNWAFNKKRFIQIRTGL